MKAKLKEDEYKYNAKRFKVGHDETLEVLDNLNSQVDADGIFNAPYGMCSLCKRPNGQLVYIPIIELDIIDYTPTIDYSQHRIQASIAIMQGLMSDVDAIRTIFEHGKEEAPITNRQEAFELAAKYAVNAADALIAELQKGG